MATLAESPYRAADTIYLVRHAMTTGYQVGSILAPPLYTAFVLTKRAPSFTINRLLRATWLGGLGGIALSGVSSYAWYKSRSENDLRSKRLYTAYNTNKIRADDHATIGSFVTSVLVTGLFWKRAGVINLVLGGAGLGSSIGLVVHYGRSMTGDVPSQLKEPTVIVSNQK